MLWFILTQAIFVCLFICLLLVLRSYLTVCLKKMPAGVIFKQAPFRPACLWNRLHLGETTWFWTRSENFLACRWVLPCQLSQRELQGGAFVFPWFLVLLVLRLQGWGSKGQTCPDPVTRAAETEAHRRSEAGGGLGFWKRGSWKINSSR